MQDTRPDSELVSGLLGGDRTALAAIYDRYADALHDTAAAMLGDRHEAADVTHDVFVTAAQKLHQLRDPSRLRPWLFAVLRHEVYRRTERRRRTVATDFSGGEVVPMTAAPDPAAEAGTLEAQELATALRAAALGLDPRDQLVLELTARQGLSGTDLADALGVSPEQSYVVVHRMRERVERSLGALTVARLGRRDCPELAQVLAGWDGTFSVLVRKRVARHVDACQRCENTRRRYAVIPLLSAAPVMAAPAGLRDLVLDRVTLSSGAGATRGSSGRSMRFAADSGFPVAAGTSRRTVAALGAAALIAVVLLLAWFVARSDAPSDGAAVAIATPAPVTTAPTPVASPASTTSSPATSTPATTAAPATTASSTTSLAASTTLAPPAATTLPLAPPPPTPTPAPTAPPTAPPATVPPTTNTTAPTTVPPAPGRIDLSATSIDLGASALTAPLVLTNGGGRAVAWSLAGAGAPWSASPAGGVLQPGTSVEVTIGVDRAGAPEGAIDGLVTIASDGQGGGQVHLLARVERAPTVTISAPSTVSCALAPSSISASVVDESALTSVVLSWTGAGSPGSTPMSFANQHWFAVFGGNASGWWNVQVTATDARGNVGSSTTEVLAIGC